MKKNVSEVIKTCKSCQFTKPINFRAGLIVPVQWNVTRPVQLVGMDFYGPLPTTKSGNKYFLIIIDYATSWIEAYPSRKQNSETVQKCGKLDSQIWNYGEYYHG